MTHCRMCGRDKDEAERNGSTTCAPPFSRLPHIFDGSHPADKKKPPAPLSRENLRKGMKAIEERDKRLREQVIDTLAGTLDKPPAEIERALTSLKDKGLVTEISLVRLPAYPWGGGPKITKVSE